MKYKTTFIFAFIFLISATFSFGQQLTYSEVYHGVSDYPHGYSVVQSLDSGYMIAGKTDNFGLILKLDSAGNEVWSKTIDVNGNAAFNSIISTNDSAFVLAGSFYNTSGIKNILCVKINSNGDTLWTKSIEGGAANHIQQTIDSGYVITGINSSSLPANVLVVKLDKSGNLEWSTEFGSGIDNYGAVVRQAPDSGYVVTGMMLESISFQHQVFIAKISGSGTINWVKYYYTPTSKGVGNDLAILPDGILCYLTINGQSMIAKTDFSGNVIWCKSYSPVYGGSFDFPTPKLNVLHDGNFIFVTGGAFPGQWTHLTKIDTAGSLIWSKNLSLTAIEAIESKDHGYFVLGNGPLGGIIIPNGISDLNPQIGIIKFDSLATTSFAMCSDSDFFASDTLIELIDTLTTVSTFPQHLQENVLPVISTPVLYVSSGCVSIGGSVNENNFYNEITFFPNPSESGIFKCKLNIKDDSITSIFISDLTGRKIYFRKKYKEEIDLSSAPGGIYFYTILTHMEKYSMES